MIPPWEPVEDDPMAMARTALKRAGGDFQFMDHRGIFTAEVDHVFGRAAFGRTA